LFIVQIESEAWSHIKVSQGSAENMRSDISSTNTGMTAGMYSHTDVKMITVLLFHQASFATLF